VREGVNHGNGDISGVSLEIPNGACRPSTSTVEVLKAPSQLPKAPTRDSEGVNEEVRNGEGYCKLHAALKFE